MKRKIQLLVPMSGQGTRYRRAGYQEPKPLIPVNGTPMISRLLAEFPSEWPAFFVLAKTHLGTDLPGVLKALRPQGKIFSIEPHEKGPSYSVLEVLQKIDLEAPVFLTYCDYGMVWDPCRFEAFVDDTQCDVCVVSYRGFHAHYSHPTLYAYCRMEGDRVVEMREKGSFTPDREKEFASSGGYYFRTASLLQEAIHYQLKIDLQHKGEYYTSLTVEALLRKKPATQVRVFEIPAFFQWGTPEDLKNFEYWERTYQAQKRFDQTRTTVSQVLMPMAGLGSRFQGITPLPKPLIPIDGVPMFEAALKSLPSSKKNVVVTVQSVAEQILSTPTLKVVALDKTPDGQALSAFEGLGTLDPEEEVLVSSCDHAIILSPKVWEEFKNLPQVDAAIFTIKGFPVVAEKPTAFAYVVAKSQEKFPMVERVSVKQTVSDNPLNDLLLVGTFWFRNVNILREGIEALKQSHTKVKGEFYLDSVFDEFLRWGLVVRSVPLEGYIGWGDPTSLSEALYWQEVFGGYRITPREKFPGVKR